MKKNKNQEIKEAHYDKIDNKDNNKLNHKLNNKL